MFDLLLLDAAVFEGLLNEWNPSLDFPALDLASLDLPAFPVFPLFPAGDATRACFGDIAGA